MNSVLYDAAKHTIRSVSVFQANRAEINRRVEVELKQGQNEVEIANLPSCLDQDSIRVDGIGHATIFDVIYSPPPINSGSHVDALSTLNNQKSALEAERKILDDQKKILVDYSQSLKGSDTSTDQLVTFLNVYEEKQRNINEDKAALRQRIYQVEDEIRAARTTLNADEESLRRAVKVTVVVSADQDGLAELSLTYVVSNARWTPLYDLRATMAHDAKSSPTIRLHYRASVAQSTGEDWSKVNLTLSTASPLQGTAIPTLHPEWITQKHNLADRAPGAQPIVFETGRSYSSRPGAQPIVIDAGRRSRSRSRSRSPPLVYAPPDVGRGGAPPPGFFTLRDAVASATEGAVSATFTIAGLSSIPSNTQESSETHKVSIAQIDLSAVQLEWVAIPREAACVFLQCKVQNTSEYVLLSGQTSIFMDNNFVSKSTISHVSPKESFSCSLGVDPAVRITYHPQSRKSRSTGNYMLSSKTTGTTFHQRITVKNTRETQLHRLILKDQVPVSDNARIKVNVLEPKDLQMGSKGAKETVVKEGVRARWAQKNANANTMEEGGGETGLGFIEWMCNIGPGASTDIELVWDIITPAGVEWTKR